VLDAWQLSKGRKALRASRGYLHSIAGPLTEKLRRMRVVGDLFESLRYSPSGKKM